MRTDRPSGRHVSPRHKPTARAAPGHICSASFICHNSNRMINFLASRPCIGVDPHVAAKDLLQATDLLVPARCNSGSPERASSYRSALFDPQFCASHRCGSDHVTDRASLRHSWSVHWLILIIVPASSAVDHLARLYIVASSPMTSCVLDDCAYFYFSYFFHFTIRMPVQYNHPQPRQSDS